MRTPCIYTKKLKEKVITKDMLLDCLFSVNKRAKNFRDKERELKEKISEMKRWNSHYYDKYHSIDKAKEKKLLYYNQKDILLSVLSPVCIHKEKSGYSRIRIYDYEGKRYWKHMDAEDYVWANCYYDREMDEEVYFIDIEDKNKPQYRYYLFYDVGADHTFHRPILESELKKYNLPVKEISELQTYGHEITDLISAQFVSKVVEIIEQGEFTLEGFF